MRLRHRRRRGLLAALVLAATVAGCTDGGGEAPPAGATGRTPIAGFAEATIEVRSAAGEVAAWCALLADDAASRARGMMGRVDLGGYDAMVFRHPSDTAGSYYMYRTPVPLAIAWFDSQGAFLSSADMAPCPADDPAECPRYGPAGSYRLALEVPAGGLAPLGVGPGSRLEVVDATGCAPAPAVTRAP